MIDKKILSKGRVGWMDAVDFQHELGEALGGNTIYPSEEDLRKNKSCIDKSEYCYPIRVLVFDAKDLEEDDV